MTESADEQKPTTRRGPKPRDLVKVNVKITRKQLAKVERVRKLQGLDTLSQAVRFMLQEWGETRHVG